MWKRKIKKCLALGLAFAMMTGVAGCGKEQHLEAEINPDIPVSEGIIASLMTSLNSKLDIEAKKKIRYEEQKRYLLSQMFI